MFSSVYVIADGVAIKEKILVVDDESDLRRMIDIALTKEGYLVETATNGEECLKKLEWGKPDLILLDVMMPGMSVKDLVRQIRDVNIAFLTVVGVSDHEKKQLLAQPNIVDYIQKPFDMDDFISRINKLFHKRKVDIKNELLNKNTVLLVIPSKIEYNKYIVDIARQFSGQKICYVNLNKTHEALTDLFTRNHIDFNQFVFIDGITKNFKQREDTENCYYINPPRDLDHLVGVINQVLKQAFHHLIFDSVTNLLAYHENDSVQLFIQNLTNRLIGNRCKGIFYALNKQRFEDSPRLAETRYPDTSQREQQLFFKDSCTIIDQVVRLPGR